MTALNNPQLSKQGNTIQENNKKRVVVAMSGGVDSSVAAALLVEAGYEVIGMMLRLWSEPGAVGGVSGNRCCTPDQMADARRVANQLNIPFYVVDVQSHFRETIVQFFIDEHLAGRTPNPCVECNREIRFTFLLEHALALNAQYLATGHYARTRQVNEAYQVLKGVDEDKDQSYVLHMLNQDQLAHVLFPVGQYKKTRVRELARRFGLMVAGKQDSQDLCFLADGDYRRFLNDFSEQAIQPGAIVSETDEELGQHAGLPFYTIGQRKRLGISAAQPLHVLHKDSNRNVLVVGPREALGQKGLIAQDLSWIAGHPPQASAPVQIKIRYTARPVPGFVNIQHDGSALVELDEPVFGVTPGQAAVFYDNEICLGGGLISGSITSEAVKRFGQQKSYRSQ